MLTDAVQTFSSVMGLVVLVGASVTATAMLLRHKSTGAMSWVLGARDSAHWLMAAITWGAMIGSLYFSEVANYAPCKLCWYQRIAMYSLAVISLVAALRRDSKIGPYTLTLAVLGFLISSYHYLLEWNPGLESSVCSIDVPCTTIWFREFGFVTLCFIAGSAFFSVIMLSVSMLVTTPQPSAGNE